jgi:hypothetical protein
VKKLISKRDLRALIRGTAAIGVIIALGRGLPAWRRWEVSVRRDAVSALHTIAIIEAGIGQIRAVRDSVAARQSRLDLLVERLFESRTVQEATAALALHVSDIAGSVEVKVNSLQLRADSSFAKDGFARIAVRFSGTGDVAGLSGLLVSLEGDSVLLAVRELSVTQPEPGAPDTKPEALRFELLIEGLAMKAAEDKT